MTDSTNDAWEAECKTNGHDGPDDKYFQDYIVPGQAGRRKSMNNNKIVAIKLAGVKDTISLARPELVIKANKIAS